MDNKLTRTTATQGILFDHYYNYMNLSANQRATAVERGVVREM
jgi:hypothetical protein